MSVINEMRLDFPALAENESFARMVISGFLLPLNPTLEQLADVKTAVSEAVTNAIIHGYGSSGKGGVIRLDVRKQLAQKKQAGEIADFVPGEDFSPFNATARRMVELVPALRKDRDFSRMNPGITLVLLK